jgi:DNA-directed RNA polymerase, mitochondrial
MMIACLKRSFVQLYTDYDPMAAFRMDILAMIAVEAASALPALPEKGDLDLSQVEQSDFFFA